jgi:hypothetical protein
LENGEEKMKKSVLICALMGVNFLFNTGWADDYNPPLWRGEPNTTYQRWEFSDSNSTPSPNEVVNPLGDPTLTVVDEFSLWLASDKGHNGVWKFEHYTVVDIPNFDNSNPTKEVWIQITGSSDDSSLPLVYAEPIAWSTLNNLEQVDADYYHATYSIVIEPNPTSESIYIEARNCTLYVDEIVVDTICRSGSPTLSLHTPNGGELLNLSNSCTIAWSSNGSISQVLIEYSTNNGGSWIPVAPPNTGNTGSYTWDPVPAADSNQCLVRISDLSNPDVNDTSDDVFTINPCRGPIVGDLNNDCYLDWKDFAIFAQGWLDCANALDSKCD